MLHDDASGDQKGFLARWPADTALHEAEDDHVEVHSEQRVVREASITAEHVTIRYVLVHPKVSQNLRTENSEKY